MDVGRSMKFPGVSSGMSPMELLDALSSTARLIGVSDSNAAATHRETLQRLVTSLRQAIASLETPPLRAGHAEGEQSTIESYRRKVMQLTTQLEIARSGRESATRASQQGLAVDKQTPDETKTGCTCCGSATCVHKQVLASHIVDLTFDAHKNLLRDRLRHAEEELESYRNGSQLKAKNEEIASLRSALVEERFRCEQVKSELHQAKIDQFLDKQASRAAARGDSDTGGSSSQRLSSLMTSAKEMELLARHTWYQSEVARTMVHVMRWHEMTHTWRDAQLGHFLQHCGARSDGAAMLFDPPSSFSAKAPPTWLRALPPGSGTRQPTASHHLAAEAAATVDVAVPGASRHAKASRDYLAQFSVHLSPTRRTESNEEQDDAEPPLSQRTMDRLGGLRFRPQLPTQRLSRTPTFSTSASVSSDAVAGVQEDLLLGSRRTTL